MQRSKNSPWWSLRIAMRFRQTEKNSLGFYTAGSGGARRKHLFIDLREDVPNDLGHPFHQLGGDLIRE